MSELYVFGRPADITRPSSNPYAASDILAYPHLILKSADLCVTVLSDMLVVIIATLTALLFVSFHFRRPRVEEYPPVVPGSLPYIGSAIPFIRHPFGFTTFHPAKNMGQPSK